MTATHLKQFTDLIAQRTGLCVPERDWPKLAQAIRSRLDTLSLREPEQYYQQLAAQSDLAGGLWRDLASDLTIGESYFFRDKGQMALLQDHLLPAVIARNGSNRCLQIWSAGCSTGEEPLTLAMLVDELLPRGAGWNISIIGTDLNHASIEKARRGTYGPWSFRGVPPEVRARYFEARGDQWQVDPRLHRQVTLREGNLLRDSFPNHAAGLHDFDLIVCRNVFIYFDAAVVATILEKFSASLREGGYLVTGHSEVQGALPVRLKSELFSGALAYQRVGTLLSPLRIRPASKTTTIAAVHPPAPLRPTAPPTKPAPKILHRPAASVATSASALTLAAQACANLGQYDQADSLCRQAEQVDSLFAPTHFLAAQLAEQRGDLHEAKSRLKRVLYLTPDFVPAYIELGSLYAHQADSARATRSRAVAIELLSRLEPHTIIETYAPHTAGEIILQLREANGETTGAL